MSERMQREHAELDPREQLQGSLGRRTRSRTTIVLGALVLLAGGLAGGIFVGRATASGDQPGFPAGLGQPGQGGPAFGPGAGNADGSIAFGTIESLDGGTITLRTPDGRTLTVRVGEGTEISVSEPGSIEDLEEGETVAVSGDRNGDTIEATSVTDGGGGAPFGAGSP